MLASLVKRALYRSIVMTDAITPLWTISVFFWEGMATLRITCHNYAKKQHSQRLVVHKPMR